MPSNKTLAATVSGKTGPGNTVTAALMAPLRSVCFNTDNVLEITDKNGYVSHIDIAAATTFTVTVSGGNYVVTVS